MAEIGAYGPARRAGMAPVRGGTLVEKGRRNWPVALFLVSLLLPFIIQLGGVRLSVYRTFLLVTCVPIFVIWLRGGAGRKRIADFAVLGYCAWATLSFSVVHGAGVALEASGILFVETAGAYLFARCMIRNAKDYHAFVKVFFWIVMFLLPFAVIEAVTSKNLLLDTLDKLWPSYGRVLKEQRLGLNRVQATFEHPILFGMFCGSAIAPAFVVLGYGQAFMRKALRAFLVFFTAGLSLSAGPLSGMFVQCVLLGWDSVLNKMKSRWTLLIILTAIAYAVIEIGSNRSAAAVFISYLSFNEYSAYMRVHIWNYGMASAWAHPLFGIGFNQWARPEWMSSSIDMFWIINAVRHGFPAQIMMLVAFFAVYLPLALKKNLTAKVSAYRFAGLFSLTAFFLTGWTVHFWNGTYVLFMFVLGASVWVLDFDGEEEQEKTAATADPDQGEAKVRYSRFSEPVRATTHGQRKRPENTRGSPQFGRPIRK